MILVLDIDKDLDKSAGDDAMSEPTLSERELLAPFIDDELTERAIFFGVKWIDIDVRADGSIEPPAVVPVRDVVRVRHAFFIGPNIYSVINLTKQYQCFVQFRRGSQGQKQARCEHGNCQWQSRVAHPKPCKHIRAGCKWHVKLVRRAKIRSEPEAKYAAGNPCPNCEVGRLMRQEHREGWQPSEGQLYYFEWWFRCNDCLSIFHDNRAKRPASEWRGQP